MELRTLASYETSLCSLLARVPVLERDLHGGFHGFGTTRGVDDRLEVRSALRQQQMGQLFERLAAGEISISACDLRELIAIVAFTSGLPWPMLSAAGPPEPFRYRRSVVSYR